MSSTGATLEVLVAHEEQSSGGLLVAFRHLSFREVIMALAGPPRSYENGRGRRLATDVGLRTGAAKKPVEKKCDVGAL
jgi:hypothetical protein